jgi:hypothetical protein
MPELFRPLRPLRVLACPNAIACARAIPVIITLLPYRTGEAESDGLVAAFRLRLLREEDVWIFHPLAGGITHPGFGVSDEGGVESALGDGVPLALTAGTGTGGSWLSGSELVSVSVELSGSLEESADSTADKAFGLATAIGSASPSSTGRGRKSMRLSMPVPPGSKKVMGLIS